MSNIKIRNLEPSMYSSVTSGNFIPMALNPDEGHERVTQKVTLSQIVSGGAVYADFSDQLKVSGQAVLTGFEIPGGGSVIEGSDDSISFGPSEPGDDRDLNLYQGGEEKISISDDIIQIGGSDTTTDTVEIVNNTLVKENFTVAPGKTTILGGPTIFSDTANFTDTSKITFGSAPNTQTLQEIVADLVSQAGSDSLSDLTDVSLGTLNQGDILSWNGSSWVNASTDEPAFLDSDASLKDEVIQIESSIEKIQSIRGVSFKWNDSADILVRGTLDVGLIAQEVEQVVPSAVKKNQEGLRQVAYHKLIPFLLEGLKDQQLLISKLEERIKKLEQSS